MGAWAYCTNEDCQRGFDRPSFAEIIARKRECPACGQINNVGDELGKALDEKFEEIAELLAAGSQPATVADDELPGLWQASDLSGGATDCDVAAGTIVPPPVSFVPGEAPRKAISHVNAENLDSTIAAGQEANTAQVPFQRRVHDLEVVDPVRSADSKLADALREAIKIIDGALYCGHELNKEGESLLQAIRATYQDHHKES